MSGLKEVSSTDTVHAPRACVDAVVTIWDSCEIEVKHANLTMDEPNSWIFGIKKWSVLSGGHRAIIIKDKKKNIAFRLDLVINLEDDSKNYINGIFTCPDKSCHLDTQCFTELVNHHLTRHRLPEGDTISHTCCNIEFEIFEQFCDHVYKSHQSFKSVTLKFEKIQDNKFEHFVNSENVILYTYHYKTVSLRNILENASDILLNFGSYWVFFWNCQDFAVWYLVRMGIPLKIIEPTLPDKLTGSGSDCSARSVQQVKGWAWYKQHEQLIHYNLSTWNRGTTCARKGCEYLPPMSLEALTKHCHIAHKERKTVLKVVLEKADFMHIMCGVDKGLNLDPESMRQYTLHRLKGSDIISHSSLVFQPWSTSEDIPFDHYHTVEVIVEDTEPKLVCRELTPPATDKLKIMGYIRVSVEDLVRYVSVVGRATKGYSFLRQNCVAFTEELCRLLKQESSFHIRMPPTETTEENTFQNYPESEKPSASRSQTIRRWMRTPMPQTKEGPDMTCSAVQNNTPQQRSLANGAGRDPKSPIVSQAENQTRDSQPITVSRAKHDRHDLQPITASHAEVERRDGYWKMQLAITASLFHLNIRRLGRLHPVIVFLLMVFDNVGFLVLPYFMVYSVVLLDLATYPIFQKGRLYLRHFISLNSGSEEKLSVLKTCLIVLCTCAMMCEGWRNDKNLSTFLFMQYLWSDLLMVNTDERLRREKTHRLFKDVPPKLWFIYFTLWVPFFSTVLLVSLLLPGVLSLSLFSMCLLMAFIFTETSFVKQQIWAGMPDISITGFSNRHLNRLVLIAYSGAVSCCLWNIESLSLLTENLSPLHVFSYFVCGGVVWIQWYFEDFDMFNNVLDVSRSVLAIQVPNPVYTENGTRYYKASVFYQQRLEHFWLPFLNWSRRISRTFVYMVWIVPVVLLFTKGLGPSNVSLIIVSNLQHVTHFFAIEVSQVVPRIVTQFAEAYKSGFAIPENCNVLL